MMELVVLTEEPSAKDLLELLLPSLLPDGVFFRCIPYEGKQDLEKRGPILLRSWQNPEAMFVVLRDQDSGNCLEIKARLAERCADTRGRPILVRIACRELESWILGDLPSLATEFSAPAAAKAQGKAKFRNPDLLGSPISEIRSFVPAYQKREGARRMGRHLTPEANSSPSFKAFCNGIIRLTASA